MISFIICSTKSFIQPLFVKNIDEACSLKHEIILVDNSKNDHSIFSAYNEGVKKAKYDYLCFIHEDIVFKSDNLGEIISYTFTNNPDVGLIGVVGSEVLTRTPFGWWSAGPDYKVGNVKQYPKSHKRNYTIPPHYNSKNEPQLREVVACDGLFLCIRKELFRKMKWDDNTYSGFHCYDLDICMTIKQLGMKIVVAQNLIVDHYSFGNPTESFAKACSVFNEKWHPYLPMSVPSISKSKLNNIQIQYETQILQKIPLAIRYEHICQNTIGNVILRIMKFLNNVINK